MSEKLTEAQRARRNLNPHAEARMAMCLWSYEYAHKQRGGSMDFWDSLDDHRKSICVHAVDDVLKAFNNAGRAALKEGSRQ